MRNLKLIAAVLFVAILLVGVFYLLRPSSVQNDTSLSMNDQKVENKATFNQRATQTKVDTPPKALKQRKIAKPSSLSPTGKKMNPMKRGGITKPNVTKLGESMPTNGVSSLPPSKANVERKAVEQAKIQKPMVSSKKNALIEYRKKNLRSNN